MTCDTTTILRLLSDQGKLSAYALARAIGCTTDQVLAVLHGAWWQILTEAGPEGWLYGLRATATQRVPDVRKGYSNSRIAYPSSYT